MTNLEKADLCERLSFPPEDDRHIMVDRLLREYAAVLRAPHHERSGVQTGDDKALALLRWGTWDMTPAARLDWKNRVEEFLSSLVSSAQLCPISGKECDCIVPCSMPSTHSPGGDQ